MTKEEYDERIYANDVADWCARELATAKKSGNLETRPFVQNAELIIKALREYSANLGLIAGAVSVGQSYADIAKDARHDLPVKR